MNKAQSCKYFKGVPTPHGVEIGWSIRICESMLERSFILFMMPSYFRNKRSQQRWLLRDFLFFPFLYVGVYREIQLFKLLLMRQSGKAICTCQMFTPKCHFKLNKYLFTPIVRRVKKKKCFETFSPVALFAITSNFYLFVYLWEISMRSQSTFTDAAVKRSCTAFYRVNMLNRFRVQHTEQLKKKRKKREPLQKTIFKYTAWLPNN